jgi:hypothetical protein
VVLRWAQDRSAGMFIFERPLYPVLLTLLLLLALTTFG